MHSLTWIGVFKSIIAAGCWRCLFMSFSPDSDPRVPVVVCSMYSMFRAFRGYIFTSSSMRCGLIFGWPDSCTVLPTGQHACSWVDQYETKHNFTNFRCLQRLWWIRYSYRCRNKFNYISVSLAPAWNPAQPELSLGQGYSCIHIHVCVYVCMYVSLGKRTFP